MKVTSWPASAARASGTWVVRPQDLNYHQSIFGGRVMALVDDLASRLGSDIAGRPVVTVGLDLMTFEAGIRAFELIHLDARVTRVFRTSMEVMVLVQGMNPRTGETWRTSTATLTLVALGEDGRPTPIPQVIPETPEEKQLYETAARRRELRLSRPKEVELDFRDHDPVSAAHLSFESTTEVCFPGVTNDLGVAKAGWLLSMGDVLAGLSASRHAGTATVTAAVDAVDFPEPVHVGDIVELRTYLTRAFRTSMEVRAEVWKRRTPASTPERVTTIYYTYVAVDRSGRPIPVPPLTPKTPLDQMLYESAGQRRQVRLASAQTFS